MPDQESQKLALVTLREVAAMVQEAIASELEALADGVSPSDPHLLAAAAVVRTMHVGVVAEPIRVIPLEPPA